MVGPSQDVLNASRGSGAAAALAAFAVGVAYALVSLYWMLGGTRLVDTVGGTLAREGRAGNPGVLLLLAAAVVLKLCAAVLGLLGVQARGARWRSLFRRGAWGAAVVLTGYGAILTGIGVLVQVGIIPASSDAGHRALRWHAYLWDPWFLVWGMLIVAALRLSRAPQASHRG